MNRGLILLTLLCLQLGSFGQAKFTSQNWHWKDYDQDSIHGISLLKAYQLLSTLSIKPTPIVVAVMDGGIDTNHLALKPKLWVNGKEIPGNGIDDDHNGYIDDIHGWNFLGEAMEKISTKPLLKNLESIISINPCMKLPTWIPPNLLKRS